MTLPRPVSILYFFVNLPLQAAHYKSSKMGPRKPQKPEEEKGDYLAKRSRNNEAVRRSREKARSKAKETHDRVSQLKQENEVQF